MDQENPWIKLFEQKGWLWVHDGNPKRPHALLTEGGHSNGYFDATSLTKTPNLLGAACFDLVAICKDQSIVLESIDYSDSVFGSAYGAIFIAYEIARLSECRVGYTVPQIIDGKKAMTVPRRFKIEPGQKVIVVEDVMTTGGTTQKTIAALEEKGAVPLPVVLVIVNRSGKADLEGRRVIGLIEKEMPVWAPDECPLCKQGSEAIRPKGNWDKLTAEYK